MVVVVVVVVQGDRKDLKTATGGYWPLLSAIERLGSWGDEYSMNVPAVPWDLRGMEGK